MDVGEELCACFIVWQKIFDRVNLTTLQLLGMRRWRRRARNGDEWRHALREARDRKRL